MSSGKDKSRLHGFYRAKVIENKDKEFFGRVKVWVPDIMPRTDDTKGLWALPGNNPISGLNDEGDNQHHGAGSSYVPPKGSWIWVFFENENPNKPYYLAGLNIKNTKILPECQLGKNPEKKWVIFKSHEGRCIVISDDSEENSDQRVEITGKKRQIAEPPTGNTDSVYPIDDNQTVILLDERDDTERILIRSHKKDFINFDIKNQMIQIYTQDKVHIKADNSVYLYSDKNIHVRSAKNINLKADNDVNIKADNNVNIQSGVVTNINAGASLKEQSGAQFSMQGGSSIDMDAPVIYENTGTSVPAGTALQAEMADPKGSRDEKSDQPEDNT